MLFLETCLDGDLPILSSISDSHLTASDQSYYSDNDFSPYLSRLNAVQGITSCGCWSAGTRVVGFWIQAQFLSTKYINKVATQNRDNHAQRVTSYTLASSLNGFVFSDVESGQIFQGNIDEDSIVENSFKTVLALFFRLYPQTWEDAPSMRWEVYGCDAGLTVCPPITFENAVVNSSDFLVGAQVRVECGSGFVLQGASSGASSLYLDCLLDGIWSQDVTHLFCERKLRFSTYSPPLPLFPLLSAPHV